MNQIYKQVGKKIKEIRKKIGITQEKAAELANINAYFYGEIERGSKRASLKTLKKISDAFNVSLADIFDFTKPPDIKKDDILVKYIYTLIKSLKKKDRFLIVDIIKKLIILYKKKG